MIRVLRALTGLNGLFQRHMGPSTPAQGQRAQTRYFQEETNRHPLVEARNSHHSKPRGGDLGYHIVPGQDSHPHRLQFTAPPLFHLKLRSLHPSPQTMPSSEHSLPHTHVLWPTPSSSSSMFLIIFSLKMLQKKAALPEY